MPPKKRVTISGVVRCLRAERNKAPKPPKLPKGLPRAVRLLSRPSNRLVVKSIERPSRKIPTFTVTPPTPRPKVRKPRKPRKKAPTPAEVLASLRAALAKSRRK